MKYPNIRAGTFLARPNRFVAQVEVEGNLQVCHVKNTGRCRELLVPGCRVYLVDSHNPVRKTRFDLVAVEKEGPAGPLLINMDSQAPNRVFGEWAAAGGLGFVPTLLRPVMTYGNSRIDYYWEFLNGGEKTFDSTRGFVEVKGVTLEEDRIARFPDAPTLRGVKHLEALVAAREAGYGAAVCFVVQMEGMRWMEPNDATHPDFGEALRRAARAGVEVIALECGVTPDTLRILRPIPVKL